MNTNFLVSNFLGAPEHNNPRICSQKAGFFSLCLEGHTELLDLHPFTWNTPTPPEDIRTLIYRVAALLHASLENKSVSVGA